MDPDSDTTSESPALWRWTIGFILVGMAWGLTTPFIRKAAVNFHPTARPWLDDPSRTWITRRISKVAFAAWDLLRSPAYATPLLINLTGSIWFFLLIGKAELSLTIPITNSLAFLFTILGEWLTEGKVVAQDTWVGIALVLSGIALCVQSKNS